jgi:hypothetical protein
MSVEFEALWEALAQYVQNTENVEEDLNPRQLAMLEAARKMLTRMDAAVTM